MYRMLFRSVFTTLRLSRPFSTTVDDVILSGINSCGVITLNRPKVLNSLDLSMIRKIYPLLKKWDESDAISHVIMEGTGNRAFCAGGDVRAVVDAAKKGDILAQAFFREEYRLNHLIGTLSKPIIALLNGITMGGGVGLTVHGMYRVATENTLFAMPETALGLFPDVGGGYFLPRLPIQGLGPFLALTGHRLKGKEVVWAGVATHYLSSENLPALKQELCDLRFSSSSSKADKQRIASSISDTLSTASVTPGPPEQLAPHLNGIANIFQLFDANKPVTVDSILRKLAEYGQTSPQNESWSKSVAEVLNRASPTSLKVTLKQLQLGSKCSFAENFQMEFRLSQHFVRDHDFFEGVRAILIDKDNQPKWKPCRLEDVSAETVDNYFTPIPGIPDWQP